jgi:hypothetical protein
VCDDVGLNNAAAVSGRRACEERGQAQPAAPLGLARRLCIQARPSRGALDAHDQLAVGVFARKECPRRRHSGATRLRLFSSPQGNGVDPVCQPSELGPRTTRLALVCGPIGCVRSGCLPSHRTIRPLPRHCCIFSITSRGCRPSWRTQPAQAPAHTAALQERAGAEAAVD